MNTTGLGAFRVRTFAFAVAACFAVSSSNHAGAVGAASPSPLQPVSELPSGEAPGSEASLLPLRQVRPAGSVGADLPSLSAPVQSSPDDGSSEGIFPGLGASMRRSLASKGESLLTPSSVVAALEQGRRGIDTGALVTGFGTDLAQNMIDHSLSQARDKFLGGWVKGLNLSYSPSFSGRESVLQADAVLSLHDDSSNSLMAQFGLQRRDGEAAGNLGAIWRHRLSADALLGLNTFYDYLSDPDVDRWSLGGEVLYRSFALSMNIYSGLGEERKDGREHYSPDGWDIELGGSLDAVPWLEYSARYYHWDVERASDLKGSDYKVTLRPIPLVGLSLRYDSPDVGDEEFGFEGVLQYRFDLSAAEQTKRLSGSSAGAVWQRRFERVRREYEQRVQSHALSPSRMPPTVPGSTRVSVRGVTAPPPSAPGSGHGVTMMVNNIPPGSTQVMVRPANALSPTAPVVGVGAAANGLLRQTGNCSVVGASGGITCSYDAVAGTVTVMGLAPGSYTFSLDFMNSSGSSLEVVPSEVVNVMLVASISVGPDGASSETVTEAGGAVRVTVSLNGPAPNIRMVGGLPVMPVNLMRSGTATIGDAGTVASGTDYFHTGLTGTNPGPNYTLTIPEGRMSASFLVSALPDSADDDNETAIFTLSPGSGSGSVYSVAPAPGNSVTVTISGTDASTVPVVSMSSSGPSVSEATSTTTVTVTVSLSSPAPTGGLPVNLVASGVASPSDYSLSGSISGVWPNYMVTVAGSLSTAQFTISAVNDTDDEDDEESLVLSMAGGTGYVPADSAQSVVTVGITDDDDAPDPMPFAMIEVSSTTISEQGAASSTVVTVSLVDMAGDPVDAPSPDGLTVELIRGGTATIGTGNDYTLSGFGLTAVTGGSGDSYNFVIPAGSDSAQFDVDAVADIDASETVELTIGPGTGYSVAAEPMNFVAVTIIDDDAAGITSSQFGVISLEEGASASYDLVLNNRPSMDVTVEISSDDDQAVMVAAPGGTAGASATLTFTGGASGNWNTAQTVTVSSAANSVTSDVSASISHDISGGDYGSVTLDDQPVSVRNVTVPPVTRLAAEPGNDGATLSWDNPSSVTMVRISATDGDSPVDLNGDGTAGTDLTHTVMRPGSRTTAQVPMLTNGTEYVLSVVSLGANGNTSTAVTATVTPALPALSMASATSTVEEGGSVIIRIRFDGELPSPLQVTYAISGRATRGADYPSVPSSIMGEITVVSDTQFTIPADVNGNPGIGRNPPGFTLSATADMVTEGSETETVVFTLMDGSGYTLGSPATHTVTISDTSLTTASVSIMGATDPQAAAITEATGAGRMMDVTVSLSAAAPDGGLRVSLERSGSATPTDDFTVAGVTPANGADPLSGSDPSYTVTVPVGMTTASFRVAAVADSDDEGDETAVFTVRAGGGYAAASGGAAAVTLTVTDDPLPDVRIAVSPATITEAVGSPASNVATFTVTLDRQAPTGGVTVNLALGGSATITTDYTTSLTGNGPDYTLMVAATMTSADFTVTAADDGASDASETVEFTIEPGTGYDVAAEPSDSASVTIVDDDAAGITSNQSGVLTLDEGGSASYTLVLNMQPSASADVTVTVTVASDDPSDDQAVTVSPASLTFNATTDDPVSGTTSGWNVPQTVTVSAAANRAGARATLTYTVASADNSYGSLSLEDQEQSVTVRDVTVPPVSRLSATSRADSQVDMAWTSPPRFSGLDGVRISASTANGGVDLDPGSPDNHVIADDPGSPGNDGSHTIPAGTIPAGEYTFSVVAVDFNGNSSEERTVTVRVGAVLNFESAAATVDEGGTATVRLLYAGALGSSPLPVNYAISGTAASADYGTTDDTITVTSTTQLSIAATTDGTPGAADPAEFMVTPTEDTRTEGPETLVLELMPGTGYIVGSTNPTYTLTIGDASFSAASVHIGAVGTQRGTIAEMGAGNSGEVTVMLEGTPSTDVTVNLSASGTAVLGTDYSQQGLSAVSGSDFTLTVPAGSAHASFSLTAMPDADMVNEEIVFTVASGSGYTVAADADTTTATMLIRDDEDTTMPSPVNSLTGTTGNRSATLSWTNPTDIDFAMVRISATTGGATADINGSLGGTDLMVDAPATEADTAMTLMNGTTYTFSAVALDHAGNESTAVTIDVTIGPSLSFSTADQSPDEGDTVTVTLMVEGTAPVTDLTVNYTITGTNVDTDDYGNFTAGVLTTPSATSFTLPMGTPVGTAAFTFDLNSDMVTESAEMAVLTLTAPSANAGYGLGTQTTHTITIGDTSLSAASVNVASSQTATITEATGGRTSTVTVALANAPEIDVTVSLERTGTATVDVDFETSGSDLGAADPSHTVAFAAGDTTKTFTVTVLDDNIVDLAETVIFTVSPAVGANYTAASGADAVTLTITDNDGPELEFSSADQSMDEGDTVTVTLTMTGNAPATPLTVSYAISGANVGGDDHSNFTGVTSITSPSDTSFTIPANTPVTVDPTFTFTLDADMVTEGPEMAVLTIATPTGSAGYGLGSQFTHTITINDEFPSVASVNVAGGQTATITEAGGTTTSMPTATAEATATVTVVLANAPEVAMTVGLERTGTGADAMDYTATGTGFDGTDPMYTMAFNPGEMSKTFTVTAVDDTAVDLAETLVFTVLADSDNAIASGGAEAVTFTITDNDTRASVYIGSSGTQAANIAEATTTSATVTVALGDMAPMGGVVVNLMRNGGADIGGSDDYTASAELVAGTDPSYTIAFDPGDTTKTFTLTAVDDTVIDPDEEIIFTIQGGTAYTAASGDAATVTVTIDDDDPIATIARNTATIMEDGTTSSTFTVRLNVNAPTGGSGVPVRFMHASAVAADFTVMGVTPTSGPGANIDPLSGSSSPYTLTIPAGASSAQFTVMAVDDTTVELDETATFTLEDPAPGGTFYTVGTQSSAMVTIQSEDLPTATISGTTTIVERGGTTSAMLTVTLNPSALLGAVTVNLTRSGGATDGTDYTVTGLGGTPPNYTLAIPDGDTSANFTVTGMDDNAVEMAEMATFTIATTGTGYAVGSPDDATVTITSEDVYVTISGTTDIAEEGGMATLTVSRGAGNTSGALPVTLVRHNTGAGRASLTADFTVAGVTPSGGTDPLTGSTDPSYTLTIPDGATSAQFRVDGASDNDVENDETVQFTVITDTGYTAGDNVGMMTSATVTITSEDVHVTISGGTTIAEEGGMATLTVSRGTATSGALSVTLTRTTTGANRATITADFTVAGVTPTPGNPGAGTNPLTTNPSDPNYTLTIPDGATSAQFRVDGASDTVIEGSETVEFTVASNGPGYTAGTMDDATVTITSEDAYVTIAASSTTPIAEDGGIGTFTVTRSGGTMTNALAVTLTRTTTGTNRAALAEFTVAGVVPTSGNPGAGTNPLTTATSDPNYTLTIPATAASAQFTVTGVDDDDIEVNETVEFTVGAGTGYTPGDSSSMNDSATVTIESEDVESTATIGSVTTTITEASGSSNAATVTVTLTPPPSVSTTVSVMRTANNGLSVTGTTNDITESITFNSTQVGTVTVAPPPGSPANATATFTVTAVADNLYDVDVESVTYELATPGAGAGYILGTNPGSRTQTITITDAQSAPTASVNINGSQTATIVEGALGVGGPGVRASYALSGGVDQSSAVRVNVAGVGGLTAADDLASGSIAVRTVTFNAGATTAGGPPTYQAIGDSDSNEGESITFTLSKCTTGDCPANTFFPDPAASPNNVATININDAP